MPNIDPPEVESNVRPKSSTVFYDGALIGPPEFIEELIRKKSALACNEDGAGQRPASEAGQNSDAGGVDPLQSAPFRLVA